MTGNQHSHTVFASRAWLNSGWKRDVLLTIKRGQITAIDIGATPPLDGLRLNGPILPTIANVHSHAFQRVMAGMAEVSLNPNDSFWSWRELMYKIVAKLSPDQTRVIATALYIDMLKAGYSQVGEFHYLHHDVAGKAYASRTEMSQQLIDAADASGLGLTLLPVLYSHSGFGGQAPNSGQARFVHSVDSYLDLQRECQARIQAAPMNQLGICFHSLRAVTKPQMRTVLDELPNRSLVHIHIAEQQKEVNDCIAWSGQRPVEWLERNIGLDKRWCLVHATHLNHHEVRAIANSGAVVGLCPTTEANLGDGIFPAVDYANVQGRWAIGSDSHVSLSLVEELRTLEYGQRLRDQQRNRLYDAQQHRIGDHLFSNALIGGNQACGVTLGLDVGSRADFMVLDERHPFIAASQDNDILNRWLFACNENLIKDVFVAGKQVIFDGHHPLENESYQAFTEVIKRVIYDL